MQRRVIGSALAKLGERKSWIFTSATLGHDSQLSWFIDSCGLQDAEVLRVASPFDYATQSALYVPLDFPKPSDASHAAYVAALVADAARLLGGRTMVLTTTLRAMYAIGQALGKHFSGFDEIEVLVQGDRPKQELLQRFVATDGSHRGCVLIGAATFWEGIDLPGNALQLLVIDKLPFIPPGDPLLDARSNRTTQAGKSAFQHVHLPLAAIALKQGAGRLIRRESDRGVLVVCDVRMRQMAYGRKLLAALPPMRQVDTHDAFIAELTTLTKPSTKGQSPP
jgi:ATP-dependent DNA helicase DinG